ncbi:hypothetical protein ACHAPE_006852 [Trichoderma viride]
MSVFDQVTISSDSSEDILATAIAKLDTTQRIIVKLQKKLDVLKRFVEPEVWPDQEQPESDPKTSITFASLGIQTAFRKKEAIRLERDVVVNQREACYLNGEDAERLFQDQNQRYFSAGADLWRHQMNKMQLGDASGKRLINPSGGDLTQGLMTLYKRDGLDGQNSQFPRKSNPQWCQWKGRDSGWRRDALAYYNGSSRYHKIRIRGASWCHMIGDWISSDFVESVHIVPPFLEDHGFGELLFGDRAPSLERAGNALLLSCRAKGFFDSHGIVIVPVNAMETPITRWRTEVISPDILNQSSYAGYPSTHLDKKELVFLNESRPVPRFLYFRFIMTLIRIKDLQRPGWEDVWARYYEQRPFPALSKYMRESMLRALATHFGSTYMHVVESWIADHGFEAPLKLTEDESVEAARRVHMVVVETAERSERLGIYEDSDDSDDESETESETESEESEEESTESDEDSEVPLYW